MATATSDPSGHSPFDPALLSALPLNQECRSRKYQGFWISEKFLPGVMMMQHQFKARPSDLLLATPMKSGTTWLRALMFATLTRKDYPLTLTHHPMLNKNPQDCFPFLEGSFTWGEPSDVGALPPPRLLATHVPYSLLPESVATSGCRIVYCCRDPKDVMVSAWHFFEAVLPGLPVPFNKSFELFCEGVSRYGPFWDHHLEYWEERRRAPERVLFLKYEEMMEEPARILRRLAEFMGCPFGEEEEREGVVEEIVGLCSFGKLSGLEVNKTGRLDHWSSVKNSSFFRKGKVGDWVNHMSPEMARTLDGITQQKLHGSGLQLGNAATRID